MIETAEEALEDLEQISEYVGSNRLSGNVRNKFKRLRWYLIGLQSNNQDKLITQLQQAVKQLQGAVEKDPPRTMPATPRNWITFKDE